MTPQSCLITCGIKSDLWPKGDEMVDEIYSSLLKLYGSARIVFPGSELIDKWHDIRVIPTGSQSLDSLLDGGIKTMHLYEIYGPAGSGKSQLAHQLLLNALSDQSADSHVKVAYIDTRRQFNPARINALCRYRNLKHELISKRILYVETTDIFLLNSAIAKLREKAAKDWIVLTVIDDIMTPLQATVNRSLRPVELSRLMGHLAELSFDYNMAIIIINKVYSLIDPVLGETIRPFGGMALESVVNYRLFLSREGEKGRILCRMISPREAVTYFRITEEGVTDVS